MAATRSAAPRNRAAPQISRATPQNARAARTAGAVNGRAGAPAPAQAGRGPNRNPGLAAQAGNRGADHRGIVRNPSFASLPSRNPADRNLAHATFRGRFAQTAFARGFDQRHQRHFGLVLGFVGPVFWPYAYDDFVDYTFYPYAYDTFWPYAFDDIYEGIYGAYAPEYDSSSGAAYAYAGGRASAAAYSARPTAGALTGASSQICTGQAQGLTDFPIDRIAQQVAPTGDQQHLLDDLKDATAKAVGILQAACPTELQSTPTGRLAAMRQRVAAMLRAVQIVRPPLDKFYQSLSDEQKERFNSLSQDNGTAAQSRDLTQVCDTNRPRVENLPIREIRRSLHLTDAQNSTLADLDDASAKAADTLKASCTGSQALTPTGRLAVMEQRLSAMQQALDEVQPAMTRFYGSLTDEQKARVDRLSRRPT